jgi:excisionase family DNA binding protein
MASRPRPAPTPAPLPSLLTVDEVAILTRRNRVTITRAIHAGELRASTGGRYLIPLTAVADWLGLEVDDLRSRCSALNAVAVAS